MTDSKTVAEALVSHLVGNLHNQVCHGIGLFVDMPGHARRVVAGRAASMRAVLVLLPDFLGSRAYQPPLAGTRDALGHALERFQRALDTFDGFRDVPQADLEAATVAARSSYAELISGVRRLAHEAGLDLPEDGFGTTQQCEGILDGLFGFLLAERR